MSRRDMGGKKPSNGNKTADRRSNLRSKGKKWREQLVQGVKEKELSDALNQKLENQRQMIRDRKLQLKKEAKQLDIELGFVDPSAAKVHGRVPEWKKQKNFLNAIFPPPVVCRKYNNIMVYRNKLSMQEYWHRVITPEEWEANMELLNEMRVIYDQENPEQQGVGAEAEGTCEDQSSVQEGGGEEQAEGEEEEEEEESGDEQEHGNEFENESGDEETGEASGDEDEQNEVAIDAADEAVATKAASTSASSEEENESEGVESDEGEDNNSEVESESESVDEAGMAKLSV